MDQGEENSKPTQESERMQRELGSERLIRNRTLAQRVRDTFFDAEDIETINKDPDATFEIMFKRKDNPMIERQLLYVRDTDTPGFREWREGVPYPIRGDVIIINETSDEGEYETRYGKLKGSFADKNGDTFAVIPYYVLSLEGHAYVRTDVDELDVGFNEDPDVDFKVEPSSEMHNFEEQDYTFIETFLQDYKEGRFEEEET